MKTRHDMRPCITRVARRTSCAAAAAAEISILGIPSLRLLQDPNLNLPASLMNAKPVKHGAEGNCDRSVVRSRQQSLSLQLAVDLSVATHVRY
jgi:hypothetical protein